MLRRVHLVSYLIALSSDGPLVYEVQSMDVMNCLQKLLMTFMDVWMVACGYLYEVYLQTCFHL